jgi:hypothetical protein
MSDLDWKPSSLTSNSGEINPKAEFKKKLPFCLFNVNLPAYPENSVKVVSSLNFFASGL